jgi:tRNA threonylcarbamoyl adenosine modification protein (Sua5/YciO/YrdC/YwlC family)
MRIVVDIEEAARVIDEGGLAVFPTETFYGLGCDPWQPSAVGRLLALKGRAPGQALPLIAGDARQVDRAAPGWRELPGAARLAEAFWPGPLSLVLDACSDLAPGVAADDGSVAVRVSSHPVASELARRLGRPLIATSANRSGRPPARRCREAMESLGLEASEAVIGLDGGETPGGAPSTLVDPRGGAPRVLRRGAVELPGEGER